MVLAASVLPVSELGGGREIKRRRPEADVKHHARAYLCALVLWAFDLKLANIQRPHNSHRNLPYSKESVGIWLKCSQLLIASGYVFLAWGQPCTATKVFLLCPEASQHL